MKESINLNSITNNIDKKNSKTSDKRRMLDVFEKDKDPSNEK